MTNTELDRLDRLTAVHVMGWNDGESLDPERIYEPCYFINNVIMEYVVDWQPTRSVAQAWECLEKAFGASNGNIFFRYNSGPINNEWIVTIDNEDTNAEAENSSVTLAIVRACLLAVGINPNLPTNSEGVEATGVSLGESND